MVVSGILVILGLVVLLGAGDLLVRGAVGLAKILKIPPLLIGLTIVAFGTSAPELAVSVQAVLAGENGIAMGNIVGSNIANVLLVLGAPAIIGGMALSSPGLRRHATVMVLATALFAYVVYGLGVLDTSVGWVMIGLIAVYVLYIGINARRAPAAGDPMIEEIEDMTGATPSGGRTGLFILAGILGLPLGGALLVSNGSAIAAELGVREELIGLTIVAFGTSLPELATVVAAALKREADVAVGNIVGSNIFNILFVGGAAGLAGETYFTSAMARYDVPVMAASTLVLAFLIWRRGRISRILGIVFTLAYLGYIWFIGTHGMPAP